MQAIISAWMVALYATGDTGEAAILRFLRGAWPEILGAKIR
jgi:hypothetical protein